MTTRWLFLHYFWVLLVLAPILAQAAGPALGTGRITTPAAQGPDAAQLAALLPAFEAYAEQARATWGTPGAVSGGEWSSAPSSMYGPSGLGQTAEPSTGGLPSPGSVTR